MTLASLIRERASELGFLRAGVLPVGPLSHAEHFDAWLADGFDASMGYMRERTDERKDTSVHAPQARSVIALAAPYAGTIAPDLATRVARYAVGDDYHQVLAERLDALAAFVRAEAGADVWTRSAVDGAPVLERNVALDAGLGWLGKSAMVLHQQDGSWFFLAELFVSVEVDDDPTHHPDRCGTCTRCIDACPTGAIVAPYRVDARRCISYLTIEHRGPIPRGLRPQLGAHLFGCDICQEVCPWNHHGSPPALDAFAPRDEVAAADAVAILRMDQRTFSGTFRGSAIKRAKRGGLARNAAVVLGNQGDRIWTGELAAALRSDPDAVVRGHAAWALGALGGWAAKLGLELAARVEDDAYVREEIRAALDMT